TNSLHQARSPRYNELMSNLRRVQLARQAGLHCGDDMVDFSFFEFSYTLGVELISSFKGLGCRTTTGSEPRSIIRSGGGETIINGLRHFAVFVLRGVWSHVG